MSKTNNPAPTVERRDVPMLDVRAAPVPSTFDETARTVDFIVSTGARGLRRQYWDEDYYEELEISETAIRLDRLNNGAPFLNAHGAWSVSSVLGVIERGWIEEGKLMARVKFSGRDEIAPILQDVRDGVLPHVSVGYYVHQYDVMEKIGELDVRRAVDWEPAEVSLVPIAFDDGATVRAAQRMTQAIINRPVGTTGGTIMAKRQDPATDAPDNDPPDQPSAAPATDDAAVRAAVHEAVGKERERVTAIRQAVRSARLDETVADTLINEGVTLDKARARIIETWAAQDSSDEITTIRTGTDTEVVDRMRQAIADALAFRAGVAKDIGAGADFAGMTLLRVCEDILQRQGVQVRGLGPLELAGRALSTSDLASIAGALTNRTLLQGYESAPRTFVGVFKEGTAQDFRDISRVRMSGAPALEEVTEHGEFKYGKLSDEKETYSLATYGKILPFTRQAIVNDDLDALSRLPMLFGRSAADLESDLVWGVVNDNAAMQDGIALFHSDHGNLGSAAGINVASVGKGRAAMRKQTGLEGRLINVMARHILAGTDQETDLDQFLTAITPDSQGSAIPQSLRSLNPVIEPRLKGKAWYLAADYQQIDTVEYSYLTGQQGVYLETRQGFTHDGIEIKVRHDFAAKAIDFRGLYKNPGR